MVVYIFELSGKIAHWKKFYTNSSSLTYYFPTRTNIIGIIASVLEKERDSYYKIFDKNNLDVGISLSSKIKKKINVVNYINTKDYKEHTQIKLELLLPRDIRKEFVKYLVYLRAKNDETTELIKWFAERVNENKFGYGVYLGQRAFIGTIKLIKLSNEIEMNNSTEVMTACPKENIKGNLTFNEDSFYTLDVMPIDFNSNREIQKTEEVIANLNGPIKLSNGHIDCVYKLEDGTLICFL